MSINRLGGKPCRSCGAAVEFLLDFGDQPIVNNLEAEPFSGKKFSIQVGGCNTCGIVQILNPIDPAEFYTNYANSSSVKREPHLNQLLNKIENLISKDSQIIDIGCNDGKFLSHLRDRGFNNLYGLEPTSNMSKRAELAGHRMFNFFLNIDVADKIVSQTGKFDCLVSRQVLEHVIDLESFGFALRKLLKPNGILFLEVPDGQAYFEGPDYALWEEHVNAFTHETLQNYLLTYGFSMTENYSSLFSGLCMTAVSRLNFPNQSTKSSTKRTISLFNRWAEIFYKFAKDIQEELQTFIDTKSRIALYGVGNRSQFFLNVLDINDKIFLAIDDDPNKQGKYLPGTSILIHSREDGLKSLPTNSLLLLGVNGENESKLIQEISLHKVFIYKSILPPSNYLLKSFEKYSLTN